MAVPAGNTAPGPLSLTEVPLDRTPVPLPDGLHPDLAIMVQPTSVFFSLDFPTTLTLPNRAGWPAGTAMDLWELDVDGVFRIIDNAEVSPDGTKIGTIVHTGSSLYFFVPHGQASSSLTADPLNPLPGVPGSQESMSFGSQADVYSGAVHTGHDLVPF
jgi:hypothetical protein